jgi:menaquinol-cytochrome c reductase iron-sulfur subunit
VSEPPEPDSPTWLVVLPSELAEEELSGLRERMRARGWAADASRGEEQAIVAVRGPADPAELRSALAPGIEADVVPILDRARYRRLRARRRFQSALVTGLGLLIAVGLAVPLVGFLRPPPGTILAPELVRVPRADGLAVGEAALVRLAEKPVLVLRIAPGRWHAVSASCTFMDECLLEWDAARHQLRCPCHGCAFDAHGNVVRAPAALPLQRLEVVERDGALFVRRTL